MDIILIRHGEGEANLINEENYILFTGQWECSLTERGIEQAKKLKGNPMLIGVERYYVSDLLRAQETVSYFAEKTEMVLDSRLRERSLGEFEGKYVKEIQNQEKYKQYFTNPALITFRHDFKAKAPGGEDYQDVCNRVEDFISEIRKLNLKKIAVVSHMCTIRCILRLLKNLSEDETLKIKVPQYEPMILYKIFG